MVRLRAWSGAINRSVGFVMEFKWLVGRSLRRDDRRNSIEQEGEKEDWGNHGMMLVWENISVIVFFQFL
jgi:hypothetical protein